MMALTSREAAHVSMKPGVATAGLAHTVSTQAAAAEAAASEDAEPAAEVGDAQEHVLLRAADVLLMTHDDDEAKA